jgi:hypothetical protein
MSLLFGYMNSNNDTDDDVYDDICMVVDIPFQHSRAAEKASNKNQEDALPAKAKIRLKVIAAVKKNISLACPTVASKAN